MTYFWDPRSRGVIPLIIVQSIANPRSDIWYNFGKDRKARSWKNKYCEGRYCFHSTDLIFGFLPHIPQLRSDFNNKLLAVHCLLQVSTAFALYLLYARWTQPFFSFDCSPIPTRTSNPTVTNPQTFVGRDEDVIHLLYAIFFCSWRRCRQLCGFHSRYNPVQDSHSIITNWGLVIYLQIPPEKDTVRCVRGDPSGKAVNEECNCRR